MKRCKGCFRCVEVGTNWKIGKQTEPKDGAAVQCMMILPISTTQNMQACDSYYARWQWNLEVWWREMRRLLQCIFNHYIRVPIGGLRKPVSIEWVNGINRHHDVEANLVPECPRCREMPHSLEQCVFCGQKFLQREEIKL